MSAGAAWALVPWILLWAGLWAAGGGLFVWLVRRGVNYVDHFAVPALLFLALSTLVAALFWDLLAPSVSAAGLWHLIGLAVAIPAPALAYAAARRRLRHPHDFLRAHPHIYFLRLDYRYLVSKSFEVLFQQLLLGSFCLFLAERGFPTTSIIPLCTLLLVLVHVPLLWLVGRFFGSFYIGSATVAAALFPALILGVKAGIVYSYLAHWLFYAVAGVGFWLVLDRRAPLASGR